MKIDGKRVEAFLSEPDPAARAVLLFGPDAGLVRERADRLCGTVLEDLSDPFRVAELSVAQWRNDPACLADEAAQIAMTGGRRVVRFRTATDEIAAAVEAFLDSPVGDALIVVEAGDLSPRSKLRMLFESADNAASLACYLDDEQKIADIIRQTLRQAGLEIAPEALDYLASQLGGDRLMTRRELEKLVLYMGPEKSQVRIEDVESCVGDAAAHSIDDAVLAAADGDARAVEEALARAFDKGESPVRVVRVAQQHFQRLHLAAGKVAAGEMPERAVDSLKPKPFWKVRTRLIRQLRYWPAARVAQALERLTAAEIACKSTGFPDEATATRCLLALAGAAGRARGA